MYGDPAHLRAIAHAIDVRADEVDGVAHQMVGRAETTRWRSLAADRHRSAIVDHASTLRRVANDLRSAADELRRHARHVEETIAEIARVERVVTHWFRRVEAGIAAELHHAEHAAMHALTAVSGVLGVTVTAPPWLSWAWTPQRPPVSGSKDWLELGHLARGHGCAV